MRLFPLALALSFAFAGAAHAGVCDRFSEGGLQSGPVNLTLQDADQAAARRACPRTEVQLGAGGLLVFEPEKYGLDPVIHVAAGAPLELKTGARVSGSVALGRHLELFATIEPVHYRLLISGYQASYLGLGHSTLGSTFLVLETDYLGIGVTGSVTLPTAYGLYKNAWPIAVDSGVVFVLEPFEMLRLHAQTGATSSVAVTLGDPLPRAGLLGVVGGEVLFGDWVSLVADINTLTIYEHPIDHIAAAFAIRASVFAGLGFELSTMVPMLGDNRTLAITQVRALYRF